MLFLDGEALEVPRLGVVEVPPLLGDYAQLVVGAGRAVLVACFSSMARLLRYHFSAFSKSRRSWAITAQLVVGAGRAVLVAMLLLDGEALEIPRLGLLEVPPLLGDPAQLVVGAGRAVLVALLL